ncbi:sensor histidine kinase [Halobacillus sp. A1]|uniref:ATP-binding protein n=1 Tax=Halobacillus sp. A1 TaxID=2880262 RepID=UPI0020A643B3|nr:sensor histidine kinase [Halobacillus sp. A1]MCP3031635.1 sensor histidine kinase [Halobacillus sp. A1]
MNNKFNVSLKTKIQVLIFTLIISIIFILSGIFTYWEYEQTEDSMGQMALQTASNLSYMPSVGKALQREEPPEELQTLSLQIQERVGAEFVVIGDEEGIRYAHPDEEQIGRKMVGGDNERALEDEKYYVSKAEGTLGPSLRGKAPVFNEEQEVIGIVSVGFLMEDIYTTFFKRLGNIAGVSLLVLVIGGAGGYMLTRSIRKDTMGLEPYQIASLYQQREAVLSTVKEGIVAIDQHQKVTMMNAAARNLLHMESDVTNTYIKDIFPNSEMERVLRSGIEERDQEVSLNDRMVVATRTPVIENGEVVGVVASFRDKSEVREMVNALSEIQSYSEGLRSQTHEHANKMYVLLGLLQLKNYQEAIDLIEDEFQSVQSQSNRLYQIKDDTVKAILLGKISKASELKIDFIIDESAFLEPVPEHINRARLVTILGNLIDNAFDAVYDQSNKEVVFSATDVGKEIIFEVTDSGPGIREEVMPYVFKKGFSTKKGGQRGFGLSNVKDIVAELGGTFEIDTENGKGTTFSVFISK